MRYLLCLGVMFCFSAELLAGGWTQKKGDVYAKITTGFVRATEQFKGTGRKNLVYARQKHPITEFNTSVYVEYGLTDRWTVIGYVPYKDIEIKTADFIRETRGQGDMNFAVKYHLLDRGPAVFSSQLMMKLPARYDEAHSPALGTGNIDVDLRLLAGYSFWPVPAYASAEVGFRQRFGSQENEIPYFAEAGYTIRDRVMLKVYADGVQTLGSTDVFDPFRPPTASSFLKVGPGISVKVTAGFEINVDYGNIISGENILKSREFLFGIAYKFLN